MKRKASVKLLYHGRKGNLCTRQMGKIADDIRNIFTENFGEKKALELCDDLGSCLIPSETDWDGV